MIVIKNNLLKTLNHNKGQNFYRFILKSMTFIDSIKG